MNTEMHVSFQTMFFSGYMPMSEIAESYGRSHMRQDGSVEGCVFIFSCENSNISTCCWTIIKRRMSDPTKKRPHVQGQRRSPNKMVGGTKSCLESNCIPARDTRKVKQNLVHTRTQRPHRDQTRPDCECLSVSCGGMGQQWPAMETGALVAADPEHAVCSISLLRGGRD